MVIKALLAFATLSIAFSIAPVNAMSCGTSVDVVNHRSEPVAITAKWFYGERPIRPDVGDFREVDVQELQANGLASLHVLELPASSSKQLKVRTLCRSVAVSNDYLNWRYSLDGSVFLSGQLDLAAEPWPYQLHVL